MFGRDLVAAEQVEQRLHDARGLGRLQGVGEVVGAAAKAELARANFGQPSRLEVAECAPQGEVEEPVQRFVERLGGDHGGIGRGHQREAADRFNPHAGVLVGDTGAEVRHRRGEAGQPQRDDPHRRLADTVIRRREQFAEQRFVDGVEILVDPERFEPVVFAFGVFGVERGQPRGKLGEHRGAARLQRQLGMQSHPFFGSLEVFEQGGRRRVDEIGETQRGTPLRGDSPDSAMDVVAAGIAEVDFAMLDDRVVPVGDVDRAVRSHLHVDRAERHMVRLDEFHFLSR